MIDCIKAQNEMYKGADRTRCLHSQAPTYKKCVTEDICAECPFRMARPAPVVDFNVGEIQPMHGGQLWIDNGSFVEKTDGETFLLGDWVECHLTSLGVTKEWWVGIKSEVGLPPTCDCEERKEWLNQVGTRFGSAVKQRFAKLWSN